MRGPRGAARKGGRRAYIETLDIKIIPPSRPAETARRSRRNGIIERELFR